MVAADGRGGEGAVVGRIAEVVARAGIHGADQREGGCERYPTLHLVKSGLARNMVPITSAWCGYWNSTPRISEASHRAEC